mgnify:CR=1 FL=1
MKRLSTILMIIGLLCFAGLVFAEEQAATTPPAAEQVVPAQPATPAPLKIDTGDTAWMIMATALVMLMTIPGLALFYGGLSKRKDTLNTIAMSFATFCIVSVLWVIYGYTFAFGTDISGIIGSPAKLLLAGVGVNSIADAAKTIPEYIFIVYQLTFAAITVALASGAYIERMKFSAWLIFSMLWMTFAYLPVAHWVWGGGFLAKLGALDFAGGTVVHINAGIAALVGALILGKRREMTLIPNNLTLVVTGAGLLWFGWFGFNAGSALGANALAVSAFATTNVSGAAGGLSWMFFDVVRGKKPSVLGFCIGAVVGLAAVTPGAGFVGIPQSIFIGFVAAIISNLAVYWKTKTTLDDTLDVFPCHGVGGIVGLLLTGLLATKTVNPAGSDGWFYGNHEFFFTQLKLVAITVSYSFIVSYGIFKFINLLQPMRVSSEEEEEGLDSTQHNEKYTQGTLLVSSHGFIYEKEVEDEMEEDMENVRQIVTEHTKLKSS